MVWGKSGEVTAHWFNFGVPLFCEPSFSSSHLSASLILITWSSNSTSSLRSRMTWGDLNHLGTRQSVGLTRLPGGSSEAHVEGHGVGVSPHSRPRKPPTGCHSTGSKKQSPVHLGESQLQEQQGPLTKQAFIGGVRGTPFSLFRSLLLLTRLCGYGQPLLGQESLYPRAILGSSTHGGQVVRSRGLRLQDHL